MPRFDPTVLAGWTGGRWISAPPESVDGVGTDTRADLRGKLFVALRGPAFDGHQFLGAAAAAGAVAALVDATEPLIAKAPLPCLAGPETLTGLAAMARGYRATWNMSVIAVTGSAGKTSVKDMTAGLLQSMGLVARTRGNWNNQIGVPLSILDAASDSVAGVFEAGMNHPGELAPLAALIRHRIGVVTNVSAAHAEFFPDIEAIAEEKAEILRAVPSGGISIFNRDEPYAAILARAAGGRVVTTGFEDGADYQARSRDSGGFTVRERATGEEERMAVLLPGVHVIKNALMAIAVARLHRVPWSEIRSSLLRFRPSKMRWETSEIGGVQIINDAYNANPASMAAALDAFLDTRVTGRRWVIFGEMGELGDCSRDAHRQLGEACARAGIHGLLAVGTAGRTMIEGAQGTGVQMEWHAVADADEASRVIRARSQPGDAVLIKGSRSVRLETVVAAWTRGGGSG